jgi:hypothetical protein
MFLFHHQTAHQNHSMKAASKLFKNAAKLKVFWNDGSKSKLH